MLQRNGFAQSDIEQINRMYGCNIRTGGTKNRTDVCQDENGSCTYWASTGECERNPGYMLVKCCKSCKATATGGTCEDKNTNCIDWAYQGECSINQTYMKEKCCQSCRKVKGNNMITFLFCPIFKWSQFITGQFLSKIFFMLHLVICPCIQHNPRIFLPNRKDTRNRRNTSDYCANYVYKVHFCMLSDKTLSPKAGNIC